MAKRRFERIALMLVLTLGGVAFGDRDLIEHAQAQQSAPAASPAPAAPAPTTPTQSPTVNPSSPNTVQQPSYTPTTPSTSSAPLTPSATPSTSSAVPSGDVAAPANESAPSTTPSERRATVARTRWAHHRHRGRPALVTYSCSYLGCVRTYPWAFPCRYYSRYCYPYGYYRPYG